MDVIMHQQNETKGQGTQFSFWVSKERAFLALQGASMVFLVLILLSLRMDFISFFSFNLGRTHMFILCNGIVAILVKGSVLAGPNQDGESEMKNVEVVQKNDEIVAEKPVVGVEEEKQKDEEIVIECVFVAETEKLVEEELEEEDEVEELSVEELNKKCDEFIKRMRGVISNGKRSL